MSEARRKALDELVAIAQEMGDYDPPGCEPLRQFINEQAAEIDRLRAWLRWIAVDDTDAQAALRGEPPRGGDTD